MFTRIICNCRRGPGAPTPNRKPHGQESNEKCIRCGESREKKSFCQEGRPDANRQILPVLDRQKVVLVKTLRYREGGVGRIGRRGGKRRPRGKGFWERKELTRLPRVARHAQYVRERGNQRRAANRGDPGNVSQVGYVYLDEVTETVDVGT